MLDSKISGGGGGHKTVKMPILKLNFDINLFLTFFAILRLIPKQEIGCTQTEHLLHFFFFFLSIILLYFIINIQGKRMKIHNESKLKQENMSYHI